MPTIGLATVLAIQMTRATTPRPPTIHPVVTGPATPRTLQIATRPEAMVATKTVFVFGWVVGRVLHFTRYIFVWRGRGSR